MTIQYLGCDNYKIMLDTKNLELSKNEIVAIAGINLDMSEKSEEDVENLHAKINTLEDELIDVNSFHIDTLQTIEAKINNFIRDYVPDDKDINPEIEALEDIIELTEARYYEL